MDASTRPQFGSAPKMAALTRFDPATLFASSIATSSFGAPFTSTSSSFVAPSPSAAMSFASSLQTSVRAAANRSSSAPGSTSGWLPARPFASAKTQSFVLMSLSTVSALKLRSIARLRAPASADGPTAASVVTTAIMVASEGAIIPEPLQMAEMVTSLPPTCSVRAAILIRVSVVMIASAACSGSGRSDCARRGAASTIFEAGKRCPITPVDALTTAAAGTERARATASQTALTSCRPSGPVSAFALPLFTTTAWIPAAGRRVSASSTGAARARLRVKHPAAEQGAWLNTRARSLRFGLIPAGTPAN